MNSGAVETLSGVSLPAELLNSAENLSQVEADLGRFAGASKKTLFAFVWASADSLWSKAGLGNVQIAQMGDLLECLVKIDGSARMLSSCIADNSDFEIGSVADLRETVRAGGALDDRPVPEMVGVVSQLDPDQLT